MVAGQARVGEGLMEVREASSFCNEGYSDIRDLVQSPQLNDAAGDQVELKNKEVYEEESLRENCSSQYEGSSSGEAMRFEEGRMRRIEESLLNPIPDPTPESHL
jgi:hypothetical protein